MIQRPTPPSPRLRLVVLTLAALLMVAPGCGDDGSGGPGNGTGDDGSGGITDGSDGATDGTADGAGSGADGTTTGGTDGATDGPGTDGPWGGPAETDNWRVMFNYRGRLPTNKSENDLWLMDPLGEEAASVTSLWKLENTDPPVSCNYGCVVSPNLDYIAVVTGPPTTDGFTFMIGRFNSQLEVQLFKGVTWSGIIDFKFADNKLYYTKKAQCIGPSCQYDFYRIDLPYINDDVKILTYPTEGELEQSTYTGHFKVSPNGERLVMLNTTIRSVTVNMWREGLGLFELDFICKFGTKGNCSGTGSEYSDLDPVAISNDGRWVVFFTFSEQWQRLRLYDTDSPGTAILNIAASVASGSYIEGICDPGALLDWQWERAIGDPQFSPDDEEIFFVTTTACPLKGEGGCAEDEYCPPKKARTNLRRIALDTLLKGQSLSEDDIFNVTQQPVGDITENKLITSFDMAGDGATLLFTATPRLDQSGKLIGDGTARQRNDREVYRIKLDGTNLQQLTNDLSYQAESVRAVPSLLDQQRALRDR